MTLNYDLKKNKLALESISIYRKLLEDKVISRLYYLLDYMDGEESEFSSFINKYNDFFYTLFCNSQGSLKDYIVNKIVFDENPYSKSAAKNELTERTKLLEGAASKDLENLQLVSEIDSSFIKDFAKSYLCKSDLEANIVESLPEWLIKDEYCGEYDNYSNNTKLITEKFYKNTKWSECIYSLTEFHKKQGCGIFARYRAFIWQPSLSENGLVSIDNPDNITLSDLTGYETERKKAIDNTLKFIKGFPANNVLFYGDRGTGKSSTVKAILNEYYLQGLRMIELSKLNLSDLPLIIRTLKNRPEKFIIFIDDLSFEENGENYSTLKAVIEGGLENRPSNVLIYATSNRRHLIKESFHERNDELHAGDNIQEKLSLSDRFGISITFSSPTQIKYLEIVDSIAEKRGLKIDKETLHREALKWEMWYNGRSPRTAKQFIDWIEGEEGLKS